MLRLSVLALAAALSTIAVFSARSSQSEPKQKDFVVLNDDGYGTSDCLSKETACGRIVADAWCESKGFARSVAYRPVEQGDVTHSTGVRKASLIESFVISCTQ